MAEREYELITGTVVGIKTSNGVVLASEKRVTYGFYMLSRSGKKVFKINDNVGIASAGILADMQTITKILKVNLNLYELETRKKPSVRAAAKLLSVLLFQHRLLPYIVELIVGGIDDEGPHIYVLDALGSLIEDNYAALGTGAKIAIGLIESEYREDLKVDEGKELAIKAIKQAISRDPVSGDGIDLLIISNNGTFEETIQLR